MNTPSSWSAAYARVTNSSSRALARTSSWPIARHVASAAEQIELVSQDAFRGRDCELHPFAVVRTELRQHVRRRAHVQRSRVAPAPAPGGRRQAARADVLVERRSLSPRRTPG